VNLTSQSDTILRVHAISQFRDNLVKNKFGHARSIKDFLTRYDHFREAINNHKY